MDVIIGVDCGATNLRIGVFTSEGELLAKSKIDSPLKNSPEQFAQKVKKEIESLNPGEWEIVGIGVGTPGPLEFQKGLLLSSSNINNKNPIDLKTQFETVFNTDIYFDRDTNVALLGEYWQGAARGKKDVVMLTLGTGVGGSLLINGEIERGASGKAGEIGHMIMESQKLKVKSLALSPTDRSGLASLDAPRNEVDASRSGQKLPICGLGHEGCLEALINSVGSLEELGIYLGYGLANIVDIFNPEMIVIGGGKIKMGDFLPQAIKIMKEYGTKEAVDEVEVVYASLGEWSGMYGGVALVLDKTSATRLQSLDSFSDD